MQWNNNIDKNDNTKNKNKNNQNNNNKKNEDLSSLSKITKTTTTTIPATTITIAGTKEKPYRRPTASVISNNASSRITNNNNRNTNNNSSKVLVSSQERQHPYPKQYSNNVVRKGIFSNKQRQYNTKRKLLIIEIISILLVTSIIIWILFLLVQYIVVQSIIVSTSTLTTSTITTSSFPSLTLVERFMIYVANCFYINNYQKSLIQQQQQRKENELLQQIQFSNDLQYFTQILLSTNSNTTTTSSTTMIKTNSSIVVPETIQIRRFLQDLYYKMNDCNRTTNTTTTSTIKMYHPQYDNTNSSTTSTGSSDVLDMTNLRYTIKYDNTNGGVWKQGFPLQPIFNVSTSSSSTSTLSSAETRIKLKIFVIPHTHIDPILVEEHSQVQGQGQNQGYKQSNKINTNTTQNNGVDEYYDTKVFKILSNVIDSLINNTHRTFVWNDIHSLEWFYRIISTSATAGDDTSDKKKYKMMIQNLHTIIHTKQLEIVTGNWIGTSDTAILNINTIEINIQEGLVWLYKTFQIQPQYALLLGSSGYSSSVNQLYSSSSSSRHQYYNYKGIVLHNIHYTIKKFLARKKMLEFNWISSMTTIPIILSDTTNTTTINSSFFYKLSSLSNEKFTLQTDVDYTTTTTNHHQQQQQQCKNDNDNDIESDGILTHIMPFFTYDISHTCGPDPSICCQFDFELIEQRKSAKFAKNKNICSWGIDPIIITDNNIKVKAELLVNQYLQKASLYRYNTLLVPLGGNLKYYYNSNIQYTNYEKLFDYINDNFPEIHIQFGTLEQYFTEIRSNQRKQQQRETVVKLEQSETIVQSTQNNVVPKIYGSFFPYADLDDNYKTTYYSQSTISRTMMKQLERLLYVAETFLRIDNPSLQNLMSQQQQQQQQKSSSTLLLSIDDISYARKSLSLLSHHEIVQSTSPRSTIDNNSMNKYKWKINHATDRISQWIKNQFISLLLQSPLSVCPTGMIDVNHIQRINTTMIYCGSFSTFLIDETDVTFQCDKQGGGNDFIVYNPLSQSNQYLCNGTVTIGPNQFVKVQLPCPEVLTHNDNSQTPMDWLVKFNESTGLFMEPFVEEWKGIAEGKNIVDGKFETVLYEYNIKGQRKEAAISNNIYHVDTPTWTRSAIERHDTIVLTEYFKKLKISYKVIDLYYQTIQIANTKLPDIYVVRIGLSNLANNGLLFADVNGNNIEQYKYRSNDNGNNNNNSVPYQSQLVPISSLAYIQNGTTRITIISDQGHGVMSPLNGFIDIQLNRGAINRVTESNTIATTIRVVIEQTSNNSIMFTNDYPVTELVQKLWDEIQHPLELFGVRISNEDTTASDHNTRTSLQIHQKGAPSGIHSMMKKQKITNTKYNPNNTYVPFVFMVFNRVGYFMKAIESLRQSDFPSKTIPIIISQDGHVPEMSNFVSSLKKEFIVIHLYHPYSCYDRNDTFPGGNDTMLNIGYKGDSYGHTREGKVTCCKHHFTWLLQKVFSLSMEELYGPDTTMTASPKNTFFFSEEDYVIGPTIYASIVSGLNAIEEYQGTVISGKGIFGLTFEANMLSAKYRRSNDFWYVYSFKSGPMTINRETFNRIRKHAQLFCNFDDYNWDWSLVNLQDRSDNVPRKVLAPSTHLVKHIGLQEGLHYDPKTAMKNARKRPIQLTKLFNGLYFRDSIETRQINNRPGYGGWGHPIDQNHCNDLLK